ncbi:MAG: 50S ribosomal protein L22 [Patescibacteria group bacterium]
MEIKSVQKFVKMSPRKLRLVASLVKGMTPTEAVARLPFSGKRAADPLVKTIKTAIANAKVKGIAESDLVFKEIQINEGPMLKRGRPVSRGMWHPYKRRMSHIRVVLEGEVKKVSKPKKKVTTKKKTVVKKKGK